MSAALLETAGVRRSIRALRGAGGVTPIAAAVVVIAAVVALLGPVLAPQDPNAVDLLNVSAAPSGAHLLGTDASGRDLLSRLLVGFRTALIGPVALVAIATAVSIVVVLFAAWFGGWVDTVVARLLDVLIAFPGLLIAIVAAAVFGASLTTAAAALSISYVPYIARVLRSEALRERRRPYIEAAWLQGMSAVRISAGQLLPNLSPVLIAQVVLSLSYAVIDLAAVSYLGLSVQAPTADLGTMVATGQDGLLSGHPTETVSAALCIVAMVLALNIVGDRLGAWADRQ